MQIIPAIDLMGGIVVHARRGERKNYKAINSALSRSSNPKEFIASLLTLHPFKTIYLADLDAITSTALHQDLYIELSETFPEVEFLLDAGIRTLDQWEALKGIKSMSLILASESLEELSLLSKAELLSLDFKDGNLLGKLPLLEKTALWPDKIIVLCLDDVGSQEGPNMELLEKIRLTADARHSFIVGGGVRDERDLAALQERKVGAVFVASALHNGKIDKQTLSRYQ